MAGKLAIDVKHRDGTSASQNVIELHRVPVDAIFEAEFKAICMRPQQQMEIRNVYEHHVIQLINEVSMWLGCGELSESDPKALATSVNKSGEFGLFSLLADTFNRDVMASYASDQLLAMSMKDNRFNCYSSSVLLADVLSRLGKPVAVVLMPDHMLLAGNEYALDRTAHPDYEILPRKRLGQKYPYHMEIGVDKLTSVAYQWAGMRLYNEGRFGEALELTKRTVQINPGSAGAWNFKAVLHEMLSQDAEAIKAYDRSLEIYPGFDVARDNKRSMLLAALRPG
jgi:tetratricopeptide (TPR) repeat protein